MPWAAPYDPDGKLLGLKQKMTVGTGPTAHDIRVTSVRPSIDRNILRNSDSGNWDDELQSLFPSKFVISSDTKMTIDGNFYFSQTPDWVIALLFAGGTIPVSYKPDGTNELFGGDYIFGNFSATFPVEDYCTFSVDIECSGVPTIGANIAVPS